jgi:putative membrane protein
VVSVVANLVRGALMGIAEVIPGVSGGTIALIVGVYHRLIEAIADAVLAARRLIGLASGGPSARSAGRTMRALPWALLVPLAIGMVTAMILGAQFIEPLLDEHPVRMRALFFGLVLAGTIVPARIVADTAPGRWRVGDLVPAGIAAVALFWLTGLPPSTISDPAAPLIVLSAAIAICALVLPGISGSFLLLSVGMYESTISAVNDRDVAYIGLFALGAIVGLGAFVAVLRWLLANRTRITLVAITGLMIGSLRALWPWQGPDRELLAPTSDVAAVTLIAVAGMCVVGLLLLIERRIEATTGERNIDELGGAER